MNSFRKLIALSAIAASGALPVATATANSTATANTAGFYNYVPFDTGLHRAPGTAPTPTVAGTSATPAFQVEFFGYLPLGNGQNSLAGANRLPVQTESVSTAGNPHSFGYLPAIWNPGELRNASFPEVVDDRNPADGSQQPRS